MLSGIPLSFMSWIDTYFTLHVPVMLVLSISSNITMKRLLHERYFKVRSIVPYCTCISQKSRYTECSV